ncbi:MAG: FAD-dependent monooxygenase [Candidatus Sericytochromatia bacterium]|nr:FAD-dependent monooxygenase [Candidatus Sericytochromatia bacterium]
MLADVAIVGGGPAGLAAAIGAARQGLSVIVLEQRTWPQDKACGEGLMPAGLRAPARLGVRDLIDPADCAPLVGVRYVQEDGTFAEARFAGDGGLGVRRPALSQALFQRAESLGVILRPQATVRGHALTAGGITLTLDDGPIAARLVVAADGLASPLRHAAGLAGPVSGPRRFGLRQHFRCAAWSPCVEVHFSDGIEAYVTPAGRQRVGVAFLWEDGRITKPLSIQTLLDRFPVIRERLADALPDSEPRGAGPLLQGVRSRTADRLVLLGDAGGYVDAITGEGLSLAFHCAEVLAAPLPEALAQGATRQALRPYERAYGRAFRRYALLSGGLLALSRRPALRRQVIHLLARQPRLFGAVLAWVIQEPARRQEIGA